MNWSPRLSREDDIPALETLIPLSVRALQAPQKDPLGIWDLPPIKLKPRKPGDPTFEEILDELREDRI